MSVGTSSLQAALLLLLLCAFVVLFVNSKAAARSRSGFEELRAYLLLYDKEENFFCVLLGVSSTHARPPSLPACSATELSSDRRRCTHSSRYLENPPVVLLVQWRRTWRMHLALWRTSYKEE